MDLSGVQTHDPSAVADERSEAAVVVGLLEGAEPRLLFIKRADDLSNHPGQMSFPGGRREPEDETLLSTALREGNEEVGLDPDGVDVVGRLDDIRTVTRFAVRPFVARVPDRRYESTSPEVAEVAVLGLDALTDRDFRVEGYTVWGATARILVQFLELATDWEMPTEVDRVVDSDAEFPV